MERLPIEKIPFDLKKLTSPTYLLLILIIIASIIYFLQRKLRRYLRTRNELKTMAENYERRRECRNELKFHFYWALDSGERKNAINLGNEILQMDKELKQLYEQYQFFKKQGFYPLKTI